MNGGATAGPAGKPDAATFERVALPHIESVGRFALSLTRDTAESEDLVQETFLRALRGWHTFTVGTECRSWLFTICRNTFLRMRSSRRIEEESIEGDADALPAVLSHVAAAQEGLGDLFDRIDVRPAIERAVAELPEPHRSIVVLVDLEGLSYEEAARVLDVPLGTVRSRLFRARRQVQEALIAHARDMGLARPKGPRLGPPTDIVP